MEVINSRLLTYIDVSFAYWTTRSIPFTECPWITAYRLVLPTQNTCCKSSAASMPSLCSSSDSNMICPSPIIPMHFAWKLILQSYNQTRIKMCFKGSIEYDLYKDIGVEVGNFVLKQILVQMQQRSCNQSPKNNCFEPEGSFEAACLSKQMKQAGRLCKTESHLFNEKMLFVAHIVTWEDI